jgi:hypothetical protein
MLRQSVFGRLAGYEDVNDAERLRHDPAMRCLNAPPRAATASSLLPDFDPSVGIILQLPTLHIIFLWTAAVFGVALLVLGVLSSLSFDAELSGTATSLESNAPRPLDDVRLLPTDAQAIVKHILETLVEIRASRTSTTLASEADYLQGQMDTQYIPSVVSAYLAIPKSRQAAYQPKMIAQLQTLSAQTDSLLDSIASERAVDLDIIQRYFAEKFGRPADAFRFLTQSAPPATVQPSSAIAMRFVNGYSEMPGDAAASSRCGGSKDTSVA